MRLLLLLLAAAPAVATDGEDLPTMIERYGWATAAAVVRSAAAGDQTIAQAHARLRALGLDRVTFPVQADPALPAPHPQGPLEICGFNEGVYCALHLPPGAANTFALRCFKGRQSLDLDVPFIVSPLTSTTEPGVAHVGDLLPCWEQGGDRLRVVPLSAPAVAPASARGWTLATAKAALGPALTAIAACGRAEHRIVIARPGPAPAELTLRIDNREDVQATACARRALKTHGDPKTLDDVPVGAHVDLPTREAP